MPELFPVIDHVVINVADQIDEAQQAYTRLGFALGARGHHSLGSSNHLAIFGHDYLELLGWEPGKPLLRQELLRYPTGLSGLVFKPSADPEFADLLRARGVPIDAPREFSRPVETADGRVSDARFRTATLADPGIVNGRVFFCHHFTPDLVWREEWRQHTNAATGIAEYTIASSDPERAAVPYRRLFSSDAVLPTTGGLVLRTASAEVLLLTPDEVAARYGSGAPVSPDGSDRMVALGLHHRASPITTALFGAIPDVAQIGPRLVVPAAAAAGVALSFQT